MKKFAFIDFHNTDGTTKKLHGFNIDWIKLYEFLVSEWKCEKAFFYIGVDEGDLDTTAMLEDLTKRGCVVRAKTVFAYKNKDKWLVNISNLGLEDKEFTVKINPDVFGQKVPGTIIDAVSKEKIDFKNNKFKLNMNGRDFKMLFIN